MKIILNKDQHDKLVGKQAFDKKEVALLRHLNRNKEDLKTVREVFNYIQRVLSLFDIPENYAAYYYQLWINNYREDGNYNLTNPVNTEGIEREPEEKTDIMYLHYEPRACEAMQNKIPFDYHGFRGLWEENQYGAKQYVVNHNYWQCLFLWKGDQWYQVGEDKGFFCKLADSRIFTFPEMARMRDGVPVEDIENEKIDRTIRGSETLIGKPLQKRKQGKRVLFKIKGIVRDGNKVDFNITILPNSEIIPDEAMMKNILIYFYKKNKHLRIEDILGKVEITQGSSQ
jgi:hypothetical protein